MFVTEGSDGRFPNQYPGRAGPLRGGSLDGGPSGGGYPGRGSLREDTLVEDPLMEEGHLGPQEEKDQQDLQGL